MLKINIANAKQSPGDTFHYQYEGKPDLGFDFAQNLKIDVDYAYTEGNVHINATIITALKLECTRCLQDVLLKIDCHAEETCTKDGTQDDGYTYIGDILDIEKFVTDTLYLEIPTQLLCSEECLGLCANCGQDLNVKKCDCKKEEFNNAFSILREV